MQTAIPVENIKPITPRLDEFDDLVILLTEHSLEHNTETRDLIIFIANACMKNNHLWQDMNLPNRETLSQLMAVNFPTLAAKNNTNMKWKKFFYRQLCEREEILICKSPSCGICTDYDVCFGPET